MLDWPSFEFMSAPERFAKDNSDSWIIAAAWITVARIVLSIRDSKCQFDEGIITASELEWMQLAQEFTYTICIAACLVLIALMKIPLRPAQRTYARPQPRPSRAEVEGMWSIAPSFPF